MQVGFLLFAVVAAVGSADSFASTRDDDVPPLIPFFIPSRPPPTYVYAPSALLLHANDDDAAADATMPLLLDFYGGSPGDGAISDVIAVSNRRVAGNTTTVHSDAVVVDHGGVGFCRPQACRSWRSTATLHTARDGTFLHGARRGARRAGHDVFPAAAAAATAAAMRVTQRRLRTRSES